MPGTKAGILTNSLPTNICFLGQKYKKLLKQQLKLINEELDIEVDVQETMNIIFEKEQQLELGSLYQWSLFDVERNIIVIDKTRLFVKGKYFWVYSTGILKCLE
ncbi:hypothetical protein [Serratia inhibens]|uniref:hypothetical protein n=1 Tax=Serratia inhibens TaxID=2338073 RepID=UPI00025E2452|nr:hypothetical protein [Serratia inhibens]